MEQDADIVMMIYRDGTTTRPRGITEVIVTKHRNGPVGTVKLLFESQFTFPQPGSTRRRLNPAAGRIEEMADFEQVTESFELIVVGGGHAGCEAAITAARLGIQTALFSLNLDRIAWQPCNPAVGGPAKSQLVHEVDALGGVIGRLADATALQKRVLNASRGPAVWALRAQTDKRQYARQMLQLLQHTRTWPCARPW